MRDVVEGKEINAQVYSDSLIVDASNVDDYLAAGGIKR